MEDNIQNHEAETIIYFLPVFIVAKYLHGKRNKLTYGEFRQIASSLKIHLIKTIGFDIDEARQMKFANGLDSYLPSGAPDEVKAALQSLITFFNHVQMLMILENLTADVFLRMSTVLSSMEMSSAVEAHM